MAKSGERAKREKRPSDGELEILELLWAQGWLTITQIRDALLKRKHAVTVTTVATRVKRMEHKGLVAGAEDERPRTYSAAIEKKKAASGRVGEVVDRLFDGSASKLVLHILPDANLSDEDRERILKIIDVKK